LMKTLMHISH